MPNSQLTLDSFVFEGFEIPDKLIVKNKQRFVIHYTGGGPVTDSLGEDCQSISFRGAFTGTEAANRCRAIDLLRAQGTPLLLTWQSQTMFVLVKEFELSHKSGQWIDYRILCLVVQNGFGGTAGVEDILVASPASQVGDALQLLQSIGMALPSSQAVAFNTLARLNYDSAPEGETQSARRLLTSVAQTLIDLDGSLQARAEEQQKSTNIPSKAMLQWFDDIGRRSTLTLARNRFLDILVKSENTNG